MKRNELVLCLAFGPTMAGCYDLKIYAGMSPADVVSEPWPEDAADASGMDEVSLEDTFDGSSEIDAASVVGDTPGADGRAEDVMDAAEAACPGGQTLCGAACVDTSSNPVNCGRCGNACSIGAYCESRACRPPSPTPSAGFSTRITSATGTGTSIAADGMGNVYIVGNANPPGYDFGSGVVTGAFLASLSSDGTVRWGHQVPGAPQIGADQDGNVTLFTSAGNPDFGGGTVPGSGAFLAFYNSAGVLQRSRFVGLDDIAAIAVAPGGEIYVAAVGGPFDFGNGPAPRGFVLASLASNGDVRWVRTFGDANPAGTIQLATARDAGVCVSFEVDPSDSVNFGGELLTHPPGDTYSTPVVGCFTSSGGHRWSRRFSRHGLVRTLTLAPSLQLIVSGQVSGGGAPADYRCATPPEAGSTLLVAAFDVSGVCRWNRGFAVMAGLDFATGDESGNWYAVGSMGQAGSLGSGMLPGASTFVTSLSASGTGRWSVAYVSMCGASVRGSPSVFGITVASPRSLWLTGQIVGRTAFGSVVLDTGSCSINLAFALGIRQ